MNIVFFQKKIKIPLLTVVSEVIMLD